MWREPFCNICGKTKDAHREPEVLHLSEPHIFEEYDPFGPDPLGHICSTYNIENPRPGDCTRHFEGWQKQSIFCHEHHEWHDDDNAHDECEACEWERWHPDEYLTDEDCKEMFEHSGAVCDGHLWEEE